MCQNIGRDRELYVAEINNVLSDDLLPCFFVSAQYPIMGIINVIMGIMHVSVCHSDACNFYMIRKDKGKDIY